MPSAPTRNLARLARLARDLEQKRQLCVGMERSLDAIERAGVVAAGERWMLGQLQGRLTGALQALEGLETADEARQERERLSEVELLLSDDEWAVADQIQAELAAKNQALKADKEAYGARIKAWQVRVDAVARAVVEADRARAPVNREERRVAALQDRVAAADRALREERLADVAEALRQLSAEEEDMTRLPEELHDKKLSAERFSRQAELLLLRSPLIKGRFQYTVLLRTPTEPGSHGINIQDSSTLVQQDHGVFQQVIDQVTAQINAGLARGFSAQGTAPPGAPAPAAGDATRSALREQEAPAGPPPQKVGELARQIGDLMYRLFMPEAMQPFLAETPSSLTITTNDLELPWELMWSGRDFLCLDRPVARMPMGRAMPRRETTVDRAGQMLRFLLIYADPEGNLPSAGREVEQIRDGLKQEWGEQIAVDVLWREQAQGARLNDALRNGEYDVIHYAGHAAFEEDDPDLSGLLLHGGEVFFAQKVRRLLEGKPLVFLNACESGRTANEEEPQAVGRYLQRPAEGLASSFVYGGAAGCIGALWPVYDRPAAEFAIEFYNRVVEGHMIGEALRQARGCIRDRYPDSITWASFVLYGDPTYQLR